MDDTSSMDAAPGNHHTANHGGMKIVTLTALSTLRVYRHDRPAP